jgi:surface protein
MGYMFNQAPAFNQNIGSWNTTAVTTMTSMFNEASAFDQDIGSWNTAAVTDMYGVFRGASAFNNGGSASINNWNTSAVTQMRSMFSRAGAFNQDLSGWCVQNNFDSEAAYFKYEVNSAWANDATKQPDWDGASCP